MKIYWFKIAARSAFALLFFPWLSYAASSSMIPLCGAKLEEAEAQHYLQETHYGPAQEKKFRQEFTDLRSGIENRIIGQPELAETLVLGTLVKNGHILVESDVGAGKTEAVKLLARGTQGEWQRLAFHSETTPSDIMGIPVLDRDTNEFKLVKGPIFTNILLADEINRAPPKTQGGLLESMAEGQVSIGRTSNPLPEFFLVLATQNPSDHIGTYPLTRAQEDRFFMKVILEYGDEETERRIMQVNLTERKHNNHDDFKTEISPETILTARKYVLATPIPKPQEDLIVKIIASTRPNINPPIGNFLELGASPRQNINLAMAAKTHAWLLGHKEVQTEDIVSVVPRVLRHKIKLKTEASQDDTGPDYVLEKIVKEARASLGL